MAIQKTFSVTSINHLQLVALLMKGNQRLVLLLFLTSSIPWNDCDNKYIGRTKRQFGTRLKERQKVIFFYKKEQSALSEHTGLCLETLYINSAHTPKNVMMAAYFLTPIYTSSEKKQLISDHIKGPLVAAFRSPLMKALDKSVETLGLWIVTSSVTSIEFVNQSSIKPCLIVHLVAVWTLI